MELFSLSGWTLFWFTVPMPLMAIWATVTFFRERNDQ